MYSAKVMDHFEHPRNVGEITDASGSGTVGNAKCGDIMKMDIKVEDNIITDVKFKTFGCCAAVATSSMATVDISLARREPKLIPLSVFFFMFSSSYDPVYGIGVSVWIDR